jgi:HK97 family phage prohead protease
MPRRSVYGLVVPFDVAVPRGFWYARYQPGSLAISDVSRVPFAFEHLRTLEVVGVMTDVEERDDGIYAAWDLDDTPAGNRAADEFQFGSRTGLSMGVWYDDDTIDAIWDALWDDDGDGIVDASGEIHEVSQVALPAFDDSRGQLQGI